MKQATPASFKPGQSGNLKGRPKKGYSITEWFKTMLRANPEIKDAIGRSIIKKALEGDIAAQKLVWNYMDGLPQTPGDSGPKVAIQINFTSNNLPGEMKELIDESEHYAD